MKRESGDWMSDALIDMRGQSFKVGDKVARWITSGRAANLEVSEVTRIENEKLYLADSKVAIRYPGRLLNVSRVYANPSKPPLTTIKRCVELLEVTNYARFAGIIEGLLRSHGIVVDMKDLKEVTYQRPSIMWAILPGHMQTAIRQETYEEMMLRVAKKYLEDNAE